jgi:hypothetical protein
MVPVFFVFVQQLFLRREARTEDTLVADIAPAGEPVADAMPSPAHDRA